MNNIGNYTWRIVDANLIWKIWSAKCGDNFRSDAFKVGKWNWGLIWGIELYPNGSNKQNEGYFGVSVKLLGMPSSLKSVFCQLHVECPQIQNKMVFSQSYNETTPGGICISSFEDLKASCGK
eukprot:149111_1